MDRIEQLVRDSLQTRARDVEPTPALWREVERRIARRRRQRVITWSLAGAAAAAAAVLVVPALVGTVTGPEVPEIAPLDEVPPVGATVPTQAVVVGTDGQLELLNLVGGDRAAVGGVGTTDIHDLIVDPTATADGALVPTLGVAATGSEGPAVLVRSGSTLHSTSWPDADPDVFSSIVVSPEGRRLAYLQPADADGMVLTVDDFGVRPEPETATQVAVIERGSRLLEWVGQADAVGHSSILWVQRPDGSVVAIDLVVTDDGFDVTDTETVFGGRDLIDLATSFAVGGVAGEPIYLLQQGSDGPELVWSADGGDTDTTMVDLAALLGDADPSMLWLDAKQDAALVGDGERAWLLGHDGAGNFGDVAELGTGIARAALVNVASAPDSGSDAPAPDPESPNPDATAGPLPAPVVIADGRELRLLGSDAETTLVALPAEGESSFLAVSVRPGSTPEDLTVVSLTTAEGLFDVRWTRVVDGEVVVAFEAFDAAYAPAADAIVVDRPVWAPDGSSVAWLERTETGAQLRTIGWDDGPGTGDPATDNAAFGVDYPAAGDLRVQEWVAATSTADGMTEIRAVLDDFTTDWYTIPLQRQPDGAWSQPPGASVTVQPGPPADGTTFAVGGGTPAGAIRWMVRLTDDGPVLIEDPYGAAASTPLPGELLPDEGIPTVWLRTVGDGVMVGSPNTATAWHVLPGGAPVRVGGNVSDAAPLG